MNEVENGKNPNGRRIYKNPKSTNKVQYSAKIKEERMNFNFESLHVQRNKWKGNHRNSLCWGFYYVSDNKKIDGENLKIMICILCYNILMIVINPKTQTRRSISYYKTNGIITLRKHVDAKHFIIAKKFEEEVNNLMKGCLKM
jgi:hypothetical protein